MVDEIPVIPGLITAVLLVVTLVIIEVKEARK